MIATDVENRTPEEIQDQIAHTRRALDEKLDKLGERLDPRVRIEEVRGRLAGRAPQYLAWGAVSAVATGTWLALRGWRSRRSADLYVSPDHPAVDQAFCGASDTSL
jgi:hypothetical protein